MLINMPLGHMANDWAPEAIWILAPAIGISMGLSPTEIGLLLAIHAFGAAMGYLPAGILSDRVSHKGRLLAMTFWWVAIGYTLASFAPGFWSLAILLAIAGMGDAAWHPIATGVLVEQMPKRRGYVLGIHAMGGTFAGVGSPLLVGFLLSFLDWRYALQISVVPTMIMGIVFIFYARHIPMSGSTAVSRLELKQISKHWLKPTGITLILMIAIYNMALIAVMSMVALFLQSKLDYSPIVSGAVFAGGMLFGALLQPFIGRISDLTDRNLVFIYGTLLATVCALLAAFSAVAILIVVGLIANIAILSSVRSGVLASAVEYAGARAATTLGFVFVMLDGVGALGAILAGYVGEVDLQYAFGLSALLSFISVLLSVALYLSKMGRDPIYVEKN